MTRSETLISLAERHADELRTKILPELREWFKAQRPSLIVGGGKHGGGAGWIYVWRACREIGIDVDALMRNEE
jgi:hypothetical protein